MALNFPDSPGIGSVFTDTTSGFSYEWDGTVWKSYSSAFASNIKILDDISGSFNDSTQAFSLASGGVTVTPTNAQQLEISLGGIIQEPATDYTVSSNIITFTSAPASGLSFFGKSLGAAISLNTPADDSVVPASLDDTQNFIVSGLTATGIITASGFVGDGSGLTGVASTDNIITSTPAQFLDTVVVGSAVTINNTGIYSVSGIITAFDVDVLSDINYKENVETVENALDKVSKLRGVRFDWKKNQEPSYGIIAQELEEILPELVRGGDPKVVNYNGIIGVLIEAIKELKSEVNTLKSQQ